MKVSGGWRPCSNFWCLKKSHHTWQVSCAQHPGFFSGLAGSCIFLKIDLVCGYHQIPVAAADILKISITTHFGLSEFVRIPIRLKNAVQVFCLLNTDCRGLVVYQDNILVARSNRTKHWNHLRELFGCLREHGLVLNLAKFQFGISHVNFSLSQGQYTQFSPISWEGCRWFSKYPEAIPLTDSNTR